MVLISPTDATIVIEIFKIIKVLEIFSTLMESEEAFNDATGAIAFSSIIGLGLPVLDLQFLVLPSLLLI